MALYSLSFFISTSRGCNLPLLYFATKRPKDCSSLLSPQKLLPGIYDLRKSALDIFTCKPMYFSHTSYQSTFFICSLAPDTLGRPCFLIFGIPFTAGCFVVSSVLDAVFLQTMRTNTAACYFRLLLLFLCWWWLLVIRITSTFVFNFAVVSICFSALKNWWLQLVFTLYKLVSWS